MNDVQQKTENTERRHRWYEDVLDYWKTRDVFKDADDVPDVPVVARQDYVDVIIPNIIRCGGIPKSELRPHTVYIGGCRNSSEAEWTGTEFMYCRHKWGTEYIDDVQHFEDGADNEYDVFIPIKIK